MCSDFGTFIKIKQHQAGKELNQLSSTSLPREEWRAGKMEMSKLTFSSRDI